MFTKKIKKITYFSFLIFSFLSNFQTVYLETNKKNEIYNCSNFINIEFDNLNLNNKLQTKYKNLNYISESNIQFNPEITNDLFDFQHKSGEDWLLFKNKIISYNKNYLNTIDINCSYHKSGKIKIISKNNNNKKALHSTISFKLKNRQQSSLLGFLPIIGRKFNTNVFPNIYVQVENDNYILKENDKLNISSLYNKNIYILFDCGDKKMKDIEVIKIALDPNINNNYVFHILREKLDHNNESILIKTKSLLDLHLGIDINTVQRNMESINKHFSESAVQNIFGKKKINVNNILYKINNIIKNDSISFLIVYELFFISIYVILILLFFLIRRILIGGDIKDLFNSNKNTINDNYSNFKKWIDIIMMIAEFWIFYEISNTFGELLYINELKDNIPIFGCSISNFNHSNIFIKYLSKAILFFSIWFSSLTDKQSKSNNNSVISLIIIVITMSIFSNGTFSNIGEDLILSLFFLQRNFFKSILEKFINNFFK